MFYRNFKLLFYLTSFSTKESILKLLIVSVYLTMNNSNVEFEFKNREWWSYLDKHYDMRNISTDIK